MSDLEPTTPLTEEKMGKNSQSLINLLVESFEVKNGPYETESELKRKFFVSLIGIRLCSVCEVIKSCATRRQNNTMSSWL